MCLETVAAIGIPLISRLLSGGNKEVEWKSTATPQDDALRNQIIQMIMGQAKGWQQPTLGPSGQAGTNVLLQKMFGPQAGINYGSPTGAPQAPQAPQMPPGGLPGGLPGGGGGGMNPWQMFQNRQLPR